MIATLEKAKSWDELQARIYFDNMRRASAAILPQTILLFLAYGQIANWILTILAVTGIALHVLRWRLTSQTLVPDGASADIARRAIQRVAIISGVHGAWVGIAALLLLNGAPPTTALMTTIIVFGIQAASIATTTVHPPTFQIFSIPMFIGFSIGIILENGTSVLILPVLYILFLLVLYASVKNAHSVLRSSYELRVQRNQALQRAEEASRQKSKFLATASHDLRQPAAALAFMSEELTAANADEKLNPVVGAIQRSSENINSLIETLFDLSKLDRALIENQPRWISISDLVANQETIVGPKAEAKGLSFVVESVPGCLFADPSHIQRWLGNLLDNAVKYTDKGEVRLSIKLTDESLCIEVADTGRGIEAPHLNNIWEDYFRAEQNSAAGSFSLGLGLSIVKRLSELLGIESVMKSTAGEGTSVSAQFELSRYQEANEVNTSLSLQGKLVAATGKHLLLVEDNPDVAEALQRYLTNLGFIVDSVNNAPAARDKLTQSDHYALLLTDNRLPDNELGIEICSYANRGAQRLPCLLVSADEVSEAMIPSHIPLRRLKKPLQTNQLRTALEFLLSDEASYPTAKPDTGGSSV